MEKPIILGEKDKTRELAEQLEQQHARIMAKTSLVIEQAAISLFASQASQWVKPGAEYPPIQEIREVARRATMFAPFIAEALGLPVTIKEADPNSKRGRVS